MESDNVVILIVIRITKNLYKVCQQIQWWHVKLMSSAPIKTSYLNWGLQIQKNNNNIER